MARVLGFSLALIGLTWAIGLFVFISSLPSADDAAAAPADGVVVYTGGGARISAGMSLMEQGAGRRLLISGVNPQISRDEIGKLWPGEAVLFDCCVDLGAQARSTEGNAAEVSEWARAHNFASLILVTSEYHMPRALVETHARLPEVRILAYPVPSDLLTAAGRPASLLAWRTIAVEYTKYLAAQVKTFARSNA